MRILAVTGSSGGHIFPALGFLDTLRENHKDIETLLILPVSNIAGQIEKTGYNVCYIPFSSIKLTLDFRNLFAIFNFFRASLKSMVMLLTFRPDIVVGFGSLASVPAVTFAWLFRIKTLIHEQNVIPGRANRLLAIFSDKIALSFAESRDYLKKYENKTVVTGNPMRRQLARINKKEALDFFGFSAEKFTMLVMGGSQGSSRINLEFLGAVSALSDKSKFQVIHLAGPKDFSALEEDYRNTGVDIRLFAFLKEMQYAYSVSDLVISRAGASTIAEIMFFGLAAILIPYPFAYEHQMANARALESKGCAVIIQDKDLNSDILKKNIEDFAKNPRKLETIHSYCSVFSKVDTNTVFTQSVLSLN
ncbi:MAG: undecaprenyldiphospho-muramoylpentapeptide beta-N-acetylglucosaminyltransferase [Candidatus Omnitrophica bacterium]|nr:undecaprenyldiphospho-muramoylpentapeptide beta-N-acetylglucosaminyltransferase [Candidatus Omnitrophota bacterium]MDD5592306.1 undecaprenyldiphospho-muramoylpentapeptide beta-N-acetylglucosaminyltransferase [Candidatus Omnitrophota bacterium]